MSVVSEEVRACLYFCGVLFGFCFGVHYPFPVLVAVQQFGRSQHACVTSFIPLSSSVRHALYPVNLLAAVTASACSDFWVALFAFL